MGTSSSVRFKTDRQRETTLAYFLPKSVLRFSGTVTKRYRFDGSLGDTLSSWEMSVATLADEKRQYLIDLQDQALSDEELAVNLSAKGLLTSTTAESVGKLPVVIKGVVQFGVSLAGTFLGFSGPGAQLPKGGLGRIASVVGDQEGGEDEPPPPPTLEELYFAECEGPARRRAEIREGIRSIQDTKITLINSLSHQKSGDERKKTKAHIKDLEEGLELLRCAATPLDAHFDAWRAVKEPQVETHHTLEIDWRDLPVNGPSFPDTLEDDFLKGGAAELYDTFGIVLARSGSKPTTVESGGSAGEYGKYPGIFYRPVRPLSLSFFEVDQSNRLIKTADQTLSVFASHPSKGFIEFGKTRWSEESATVTFGENGELATVSTVKKSPAAAVAAAAGELPAEVLSVLENANKIVDEAQKASLQGIESRVSHLTARKGLLEADIALDTAADSRGKTEELARIKSEIEVLQQKKILGDTQRDLDSGGVHGGLAMEKELVNLRFEIEKIRLDRLKVEATMAELLKGSS